MTRAGFSDRPYRHAATYPTSYFNGFLFDQLFGDIPPNAAMTFNVYDGVAEATFEGPLISILALSTYMQLLPDNTTLVEYEVIQSPEQEAITPLSNFFFNGSESMTFEHCSIFIDTTSEGAQGFFRPTNTLPDIARRLKVAAQKMEVAIEMEVAIASTSPALQKYAKIWQINGKGGVDSKDYVKGAADTIKAVATFIEQCKKTCDAKAIVNGVSGLFLASAFVVGAAFPPLGIAMFVIGAIGTLVAALFLDSNKVSVVDYTITPSMIQAAVDRALTSFTVQADTETLRSLSTFFQIDINNYASFVGALGYIKEKSPSNYQPKWEQQIDWWYTQQFSPAWTGVYQNGIVELEAKYTTWFGASDLSGIRRKLKDYKAFCDTKTCNITDGDTSFFEDGANRVKLCKEKVDDARTNWEELIKFANAYLKTASQLTSFAAQASGIFQLASFCDPSVYPDDVILTDCNWIHAIEDLSIKVSVIQTRALYLSTIMQELSLTCGPPNNLAHGWPFNQECNTDKCNYKYILAISNTQYEDRLASTNEEGKFKQLGKSYYQQDSVAVCKRIYDGNNERYGYGHGGLYGYDSSGPKLVKGDCSTITNTANQGGFIILGALPSWCMNDDFPTCANYLANDAVWGDTL